MAAVKVLSRALQMKVSAFDILVAYTSLGLCNKVVYAILAKLTLKI